MNEDSIPTPMEHINYSIIDRPAKRSCNTKDCPSHAYGSCNAASGFYDCDDRS